ncbi:MAG: hypothetical protein WD939_04155 [Dehalococcoidia bacterium]
MEEKLRRAEEQAWRFESRPLITLTEHTIDLADLDPFVVELQKVFNQVVISRQRAGPAAGGLYPDAAIYIALGGAAVAIAAAAQGFFSELGKDAYRGLRKALYSAYSRTRTETNGRKYSSLAIEVPCAPESSLLFLLRPGLDEESFENALLALIEVLQTADSEPPAGMMSTWMEWDVDGREWVARSW